MGFGSVLAGVGGVGLLAGRVFGAAEGAGRGVTPIRNPGED